MADYAFRCPVCKGRELHKKSTAKVGICGGVHPEDQAKLDKGQKLATVRPCPFRFDMAQARKTLRELFFVHGDDSPAAHSRDEAHA